MEKITLSIPRALLKNLKEISAETGQNPADVALEFVTEKALHHIKNVLPYIPKTSSQKSSK